MDREQAMTARTALVPGALGGPDGTEIGCPAADLVAGELARRGLVPMRSSTPAPAGDHVVAERIGAGLALAVLCAEADRPVAREVLDAWRQVAGERRVVLASPRSFCAGVERAVDMVEQALRLRGAPVYVRREIVHNAHIVADLAGRGVIFVDELDEVPPDATVVFSAHGVAPIVHADADRRRLDVIDATCPLVAKVHTEARRFAARGDTVLLIGHDGHDEVEGTMGQVPGQIRLVEDVAQARTIEVDDASRVSYLTQTTLAADETSEILAVLRQRFPLLAGPPSADICYATTNRQEAVTAVAAESDLLLVVGSANSSNSVRLVELSERLGTPAHLIDDARDIRPQWLAGVRTVGLSAGASAPPYLVDQVVTALSGLGAVTVSERRTSEETVTFVLPPSLRG